MSQTRKVRAATGREGGQSARRSGDMIYDADLRSCPFYMSPGLGNFRETWRGRREENGGTKGHRERMVHMFRARAIRVLRV